MNFVAEILCSAEKIEIENLNKRIPDILLTIDAYKQDVLQYINEIYSEFCRKPKSNALLLNKANDLMNNICEIQKTVSDITNNDVNKIKDKVTVYKQELNESKHALKLATTLIDFHENLIKLKTYAQNNEYVEGIKLIEQINQYRNDSDIIQIDAFNGLIETFLAVKDSLMVHLIKDYKESIQYSRNQPFTLTVRKDKNIVEILMAVGLSNMDLLDEFTEFVWDNIFSAIINHEISLNITENDESSKLIIRMINENKKEDYLTIFKNLISAANFLSNNLNYSLKDNMSMLDCIRIQIDENLSELIIKNCLVDTIPSNNDELQKYNTIIQEVEHLHSELIKCRIFAEDTDSIINYVKNIDVLFINKKCEEYISQAREIMKRDLHDMVEIGEKSDETNSLTIVSNTFPYCFISKSTLDLIDLADKIMQNAITSEASAEQLFSTVQNIFHIYGSVVETYHQKLLQTIPQQVALFHNNCLYLSFKLSTWTETYKSSTVQIEPILFMEKAHLLKQIGNRAFIDSLQQQINQIEDIMKESGLMSLSTLEKLEPVTEKSIRQCLRQQELLRTVWHKVLSHTDYNRSVGCILNFLCNFIINQILNIEDISSTAGDQLIDIFKVILTRGPKLFIDPKDVHIYVKNWYRFNELVFILSSSLVEICDRWTDGKGPLALQFKPEEVQKLIRALFQNTDRRAAVLARIIK